MPTILYAELEQPIAGFDDLTNIIKGAFKDYKVECQYITKDSKENEKQIKITNKNAEVLVRTNSVHCNMQYQNNVDLFSEIYAKLNHNRADNVSIVSNNTWNNSFTLDNYDVTDAVPDTNKAQKKLKHIKNKDKTLAYAIEYQHGSKLMMSNSDATPQEKVSAMLAAAQKIDSNIPNNLTIKLPASCKSLQSKRATKHSTDALKADPLKSAKPVALEFKAKNSNVNLLKLIDKMILPEKCTKEESTDKKNQLIKNENGDILVTVSDKTIRAEAGGDQLTKQARVDCFVQIAKQFIDSGEVTAYSIDSLDTEMLEMAVKVMLKANIPVDISNEARKQEVLAKLDKNEDLQYRQLIANANQSLGMGV